MAHGNRYHSFSNVTPNDTPGPATGPFDALFVGGTGNISVKGEDGKDVVFTGVPVGIFYVAGKSVNATGTTATNIAALRG